MDSLNFSNEIDKQVLKEKRQQGKTKVERTGYLSASSYFMSLDEESILFLKRQSICSACSKIIVVMESIFLFDISKSTF